MYLALTDRRNQTTPKHRLPTPSAMLQAGSANPKHRLSTRSAMLQAGSANQKHCLSTRSAMLQAGSANPKHRLLTPSAMLQAGSANPKHRLPTRSAMLQPGSANPKHRLPTRTAMLQASSVRQSQKHTETREQCCLYNTNFPWKRSLKHYQTARNWSKEILTEVRRHSLPASRQSEDGWRVLDRLMVEGGWWGEGSAYPPPPYKKGYFDRPFTTYTACSLPPPHVWGVSLPPLQQGILWPSFYHLYCMPPSPPVFVPY